MSPRHTRGWAPARPRDWWRDAVVYQVYPRSFADSDGDGVGDLPGITARLEHVARLGVDAVWICPFFRSPMSDGGYDVADHRDVDPLFGTLADADALVSRAGELGLGVLVDLVPNHHSSAHPWFQAALAAGPGSPERARYLFRDGRGPRGDRPPNNWQSVFGGAAWTRVTEADGRPGQWYLHLFDSSQPDLDWTNPHVREDFESILRFWLDCGVAGFRVDVAHGLVKAPGLPDHAGPPTVLGLGAGDPVPTHQWPFWDQDGVHEVYAAWRRLLDSCGPPARILCAEAWVTPPERMARYLRPTEMHQAFAFGFLESAWQATALRASIDSDLHAVEAVGAPCTWVLSNHDVVRHASRLGLPVGSPRPHGIGTGDPQPDEALGLRRARAATTLMLALPGAAYLYQGEELGLPEHTTLPDELREDPAFARTGGLERGRDGARIPLPWTADAPGMGFGPSGRTWLPQPPHYRRYAADQQEGRPDSTLELYRTLLRLRREHGLGRRRLEWSGPSGQGDREPDSAVVSFRSVAAPREGGGSDGGTGRPAVAVVVNLGAEPVRLPAGSVLVCSEALTGDGRLPTDTAAWVVIG